MNNKKGYLQLIAAKTVECGACNGRGFRLEVVDLKTPMPDCDICKGSGRVLDPKFEGLRDYQDIDTVDLNKGYTVVRDLAVLLECLRDAKIKYKMIFHVINRGESDEETMVEVGVGGRHWGYGNHDDFCRAVWEYLEREKVEA